MPPTKTLKKQPEPEKSPGPRPAPAPTISDTLFFDDGNIILDVIEDEDKKMRYRVHKSILARNSTFFADMFKIPQPGDTNSADPADDCPVVSLTGDTIVDWDIMIGALYNPFFNHTQQSVEKIIAMLRIGKKYAFDGFLSDADTRLRECYPSTLEQFRKRKTHRSIGPSSVTELLEVVHEDILPDDILPVLYYDNMSFMTDFDEQESEDALDITNTLKLRLVVGHRRLLNAQAQHTFGWLRKGISPDCTDPGACKFSFREIQRSLDTPGYSGSITLRPFERFTDITTQKSAFCKNCRKLFINKMEEGAETVWFMLPGCFGLGSWNELTESEDSEDQSDHSQDNDDVRMD